MASLRPGKKVNVAGAQRVVNSGKSLEIESGRASYLLLRNKLPPNLAA